MKSFISRKSVFKIFYNKLAVFKLRVSTNKFHLAYHRSLFFLWHFFISISLDLRSTYKPMEETKKKQYLNFQVYWQKLLKNESKNPQSGDSLFCGFGTDIRNLLVIFSKLLLSPPHVLQFPMIHLIFRVHNKQEWRNVSKRCTNWCKYYTRPKIRRGISQDS